MISSKPFAGAVLLFAAFSLSGAAWRAVPDDLPRKLGLGAVVAPVTDDIRKREKLGADEGVLIQTVLPETSAQSAGLQAGDVLLTINGAKIAGAPQIASALAAGKPGDVMTIEITRGGEKASKKMTLKERPREKSDDIDIVYDSVVSGGARMRTIITKPRTPGKHPALLFIQGLGCFSIDNPMPGVVGNYKTMAYALSRAGFVTLRVDKPGMGDSEGGPCSEATFEAQTEAFRQALKALKGYEYVDANNVFIFGHSMGGFMGPLIAGDVPIKGILVYGTGLKPWNEYLLENNRRQMLLEGSDAGEIERTNRNQAALDHYLFVEKKTPKEIADAHPDLKEFVHEQYPDYEHQFGHTYRFFQSLGAASMSEAWKRVDAYVLAVHGAGDFVSGADDHQMIAKYVNKIHPGKGEYRELPDSDHWLFRAANEEASFKRGSSTGDYNPALLETLKTWMAEKAKSS